MPITPSTLEELHRAHRLVLAKELAIRRLVAQGKKVHVIWDLDFVLFSGRSDDVFGLLGFDVKKYFTYEERLITDVPESGLWMRIAQKCGDYGLQCSQDVVTARSSFLAQRAQHALISGRIPVRWQLFVGHQSKADSYRIILKSFEKDADMHVFCVDDAKKHVDAFTAVAAELGMSDRCHGVLAPQTREYDEVELRRGIDGVMNAVGSDPFIVTVNDGGAGKYRRQLQVTPDPMGTLRSMFWGAFWRTHVSSTVNASRRPLEDWANEIWPGQKQTDETLFMMSEMLREPG